MGSCGRSYRLKPKLKQIVLEIIKDHPHCLHVDITDAPWKNYSLEPRKILISVKMDSELGREKEQYEIVDKLRENGYIRRQTSNIACHIGRRHTIYRYENPVKPPVSFWDIFEERVKFHG